jgi:hypothetical protein
MCSNVAGGKNRRVVDKNQMVEGHSSRNENHSKVMAITTQHRISRRLKPSSIQNKKVAIATFLF